MSRQRLLIIVAGNRGAAEYLRRTYRRHVAHDPTRSPWRGIRLLTAAQVRQGALRGLSDAVVWVHYEGVVRSAGARAADALYRDLRYFDARATNVEVVQI